jgi:outer membrane protein insertion porin family
MLSSGLHGCNWNATPRIDDALHQVAYTITVDPGEQYRIHEVTANNLDAAARADFDRGFRMKAGELYNPDYISGFLKNNTALQALAGYSAGYKAYADPNTHTVDLVINFVR